MVTTLVPTKINDLHMPQSSSQLAPSTHIQKLGLSAEVADQDIVVVSANNNTYGVPDEEIINTL